MDVKSVVVKLCSRYDTRDPFEIIRQRKILLLFEPLGSIKGYYSQISHQQFIHINNGLLPEEYPFVAAHELGHALLHPTANTPFLRDNTFLSVSRLEREANQFAAQLLLSDEDIYQYRDYTLEQLSATVGFPQWLVEWRVKQVNINGGLRR